MSLLTSPSNPQGELFISQLQNPNSHPHLFTPDPQDLSHPSRKPPPHCLLMQRLGGYSSGAGGKILREFGGIMEESSRSMQITDSIKWYETRRGLDEALKVCKISYFLLFIFQQLLIILCFFIVVNFSYKTIHKIIQSLLQPLPM